MPSVRRLRAEEWRLYRELRLAALRDSPNAFGSTLAREEAFPDAQWSERLGKAATSRLDHPLVAEVTGHAVGLAWARIEADDPGTATLYQVWVQPEARRHGVGQRLLDTAIAWAREEGAGSMELGVTIAPGSALEFYRRAGFTEVGERTPLRAGSVFMQQRMRITFHAMPHEPTP
ncbi:MAG: GNAT family N-acetyltransferase [bacterium]